MSRPLAPRFCRRRLPINRVRLGTSKTSPAFLKRATIGTCLLPRPRPPSSLSHEFGTRWRPPARAGREQEKHHYVCSGCLIDRLGSGLRHGRLHRLTMEKVTRRSGPQSSDAGCARYPPDPTCVLMPPVLDPIPRLGKSGRQTRASPSSRSVDTRCARGHETSRLIVR